MSKNRLFFAAMILSLTSPVGHTENFQIAESARARVAAMTQVRPPDYLKASTPRNEELQDKIVADNIQFLKLALTKHPATLTKSEYLEIVKILIYTNFYDHQYFAVAYHNKLDIQQHARGIHIALSDLNSGKLPDNRIPPEDIRLAWNVLAGAIPGLTPPPLP